ncbi:MAG TPA: bi-domain-containing oxidoreductase, partial [Candidatus Hodarchaeales archaeon]|nr:bi-domain-containing oxidoreductase [Candidatus Hodarchaeales archaeon]
KQAGPVQAYRTLMKKLDSYSPLGYSSAGYVIGIGDGISDFAIGDKVACGGSTANHAEVVAAPKNLCVKLHPDADLKGAAYNTLGAIAFQGIRQVDLRLGESCAVIGLGLLGQLTCLLLRAGGIKTVGIDIDPWMVEIAKAHAADISTLRTEDGLAERIEQETCGLGVDGVIITAATDSLDPINFAGRILKKKGRVVIVGNVPTGFDREPYFYRKEIDLRMSCSYGPGRYDPLYEEKGIDYPPAYVRWTERRNMEAFQELVYSNRVDIAYLTTHVFPLNEANKAYDLIMQKSEPYIGIVIKYENETEIKRKVFLREQQPAPKFGNVAIAFIGAGSYAMSHLLPNIPREKWITKRGVMTASGLSARSVLGRFGFDFCTSDESEILKDDSINTVFIATRHNSHAEFVRKSLSSGKHVFVEKPLCITETELRGIEDLVTTPSKALGILMVGFNRRFSPLTDFVRARIAPGPMSMIYRVNAGAIPPDSWIQDREMGGGRIIGEMCHFIDLMTFINGSLPAKIQAFGLPATAGQPDTVTMNISFENGSIGTISYFANGPKILPKEYLEIYKSGVTAILKDFKEVEIYSSKHMIKKKLLFQNKGQAAMVKSFLTAVKNGEPSPISFAEIFAVTRATLRAEESIESSSVILM